MAVFARADLQGYSAGRFESLLAKALGQREQAQTGTVAMLGMFVLLHQACHRDGCGRADGSAPVDQALWCPFHVRLVRGRHVRGHGAKAAGPAVADMAGDALGTVEQFDRARGDARLQDLAHQGVRNAIAMLLDFHVIVDVDRDGLEVRDLITLHRQGLQCRRIELGKGAGAAARQFLERAFVESLEQGEDRAVDVVERGEFLVPQARHDPAFNDLDSGLDLAFVLWRVWPRRQDRCPIVAGEIEHGVIGARLVTVRVGDHGARIIGHDQLGRPAEISQCLHRRLDPVNHRFPRRGTGEGIA